jgi:hypothetical protein
MAELSTSFDINDLAQDLTVHIRIHGTKAFALRLKLAVALFRWGARVLGSGIEIESQLEAKE